MSIDLNPVSLRMDWLDPADPRPSLQRLLRDWLRVQIAFGLHPETFAARLRSLGSARKLLDSAKTSSPVSTDEVERHVEILRRDCVRMLPLLSSCYPERVSHLRDPALVLFLRGRGSLELLERPIVAIVGARAATVYGRKVARDLARELAALGIVVISGLARGVDAMAHEGALDAGGVTLAVQACGPERIYPPEHRGLASRIREAGLVLTEMPPGTPPRAPYFPLRNRLISGLASAVVVVEARLRSGSLVTARHALLQGREVLAVPGPIRAPTSEGTNQLLRDGARPCLDATDVLDALGWSSVVPSSQVAAGPALPDDAGSQAIVEALREAPASRDELAQRLSLGPGEIASGLLELELAGWVAEDRDGRFRIPAV